MENTNIARNQFGNVVRRYPQVCVWSGTVVAKDAQLPSQKAELIRNFEVSMKTHYGWTVQYLEEITTGPDLSVSSGQPIEGTGGRNDLFFCVASEDIGKMAVQRLAMGIRWLEDVLAHDNYTAPIYPGRVFQYLESEPETTKPAEELPKALDPAAALAKTLFALLKPEMEQLVEETVERKVQGLFKEEEPEEVFAGRVMDVLREQPQTVGEIIVDEVQRQINFDNFLDSHEFQSAVNDIMSNTDIEVTIRTR